VVTSKRIAGAIALFLLASVPLAAQTPAPPYVKPEGLRQISPHVHVIPDNSVPAVPNVGIVVGTTAVLVIDTGLGPPNGAKVLAEAQKLGASRQLYLVTTHFHPEHDLGAQAFPATTRLIRSTDQEKDIAEFGLQLARVFASRSPIHAELLAGASFRKADITFEREYDLDLGGVRARVIAMGANHTRGDTAVWIEADRVLFSGDVAMRAQPAFASPYSTIAQWLASLDRLESFKPSIVVPSHGPNGDGTAFITGYRTYLTEVRDRTTAEKRDGKTLDQATQAVATAMSARYPDRNRLASAIRAAFAEAR
jgi:glyoxylase-like metal-dependent hydrolase (beta-lactamase superfamily II)